ncbi:MAG TPA: hypothetical protein VE754_02205 [Actinomycetota bacterium]|nr:hypothetical protein [Actinomycetota bacterium]
MDTLTHDHGHADTHDHGHADTHDHGHGAGTPEGVGLTGFAIAKYGFILIITIVILWFIANYFLGE